MAGRAAEIVRQMMAYAGHETADLEPVDLSRLVGEMTQLLEISISKKVTLKMDLQENLPAVLANPAQIQQVIMNLITNAAGALGERGGVVTIATSDLQAEVCSPARTQDLRSGVRLEVSDTGCGMREEIRSKIFDPFFTTKFAGCGLWLAAVHGIVRSHGGTINVISAPGRGSRFGILLPRAARFEVPGKYSLCPIFLHQAQIVIKCATTLNLSTRSRQRLYGSSPAMVFREQLSAQRPLG